MKVVGDVVTISRSELLNTLAECTIELLAEIKDDDAESEMFARIATISMTGLLADKVMDKVFGEGLTEDDVKKAEQANG